MNYKIPVNGDDNGTIVKPKLAYRGFKKIDGVIDIGANVAMLHNRLSVAGMYHTNQSMTVAVGLGIRQVGLIFSYTNDMGPFKTYAATTFEVGLKFTLLTTPKEKAAGL